MSVVSLEQHASSLDSFGPVFVFHQYQMNAQVNLLTKTFVKVHLVLVRLK